MVTEKIVVRWGHKVSSTSEATVLWGETNAFIIIIIICYHYYYSAHDSHTNLHVTVRGKTCIAQHCIFYTKTIVSMPCSSQNIDKNMTKNLENSKFVHIQT